jgi:uncharacterized protein Yka (UPF0111/DUF47 family)
VKLNNILNIFTPKDAKFLSMLNETAEILNKSAELLHKLFSSSEQEQIEEFCQLIKIGRF